MTHTRDKGGLPHRQATMKISWIANVRNAISFISPYTWVGILKQISMSLDKDLKAPSLVIWIVHLFVPFVFITLALNNANESYGNYQGNGITTRLIGSLKTASIVTLLSTIK